MRQLTQRVGNLQAWGEQTHHGSSAAVYVRRLPSYLAANGLGYADRKGLDHGFNLQA